MLFGMVDEIRHTQPQSSSAEVMEGWIGLLAYGSVGQAEVLLRYYEGDDNKSPLSQLFLLIINIIRKYVEF